MVIVESLVVLVWGGWGGRGAQVQLVDVEPEAANGLDVYFELAVVDGLADEGVGALFVARGCLWRRRSRRMTMGVSDAGSRARSSADFGRGALFEVEIEDDELECGGFAGVGANFFGEEVEGGAVVVEIGDEIGAAKGTRALTMDLRSSILSFDHQDFDGVISHAGGPRESGSMGRAAGTNGLRIDGISGSIPAGSLGTGGKAGAN